MASASRESRKTTVFKHLRSTAALAAISSRVMPNTKPWPAIRAVVKIPVFANGDIDSPQAARRVLELTRCDGVMIGRAAQGRPWIFDEVNFFLAEGESRATLALEKVRDIMRAHLEDLYAFYGEETGVRVARKHLSWYFRQHPGQEALRNRLVQIETPQEQLSTLLESYDTRTQRAA